MINFIKKIKAVYIYTAFIFIISIVYQSSILKSNEYIAKFVNDEYHTVRLVSTPFFKSIEDSRVMGGERFFLRITYPAPIYYMTMRMGGDVYETEGWNYPGHKYILKNSPNEDTLKSDPNLQDYMYAYRMIQYIFFALCVTIASFAMWNNISPAASFSYVILIFGSLALFNSPIIERESLYVYPDIFLGGIASMLFGIFLCYRKSKNLDYLILLIAIFACSVKINGLIIGIPCLIFIYLNKNINALKILKIIIIFSIIFNIYELKYIDNFFHYQFSNLWHYNTGDGGPDISGMTQIYKGFKEIGYLIYLLPLSFAIHLYLLKSKNISKKTSILLFSTLLIGVVYELILSRQRVFIARNYLQIYIIYALYFSTAIGIFVNSYFKSKYLKYYVILGTIAFFLYNNKYFSNAYYLSSTIKMSEKCLAPGVILPTKVNGYREIDGLPETYNLANELPLILNTLDGYDCLILKWDQVNKQLTNFYLPKSHTLVARNGDYFLYLKNK